MQKRIDEFFKNHKIQPDAENARSYVFNCPCCGGKLKLYIQKEDGRSVCFKGKDERCPKPGSNVTYGLTVVSGLTYKQVKEEVFDYVTPLTDEINVSFDDETVVKTREPLKTGTLPFDIAFIDDLEALEGATYLINRGLTMDVLKAQNVLYSPVKRRVIFPVIMHKNLYGYQGRAIDPVEKHLRMENLKGDWKARTLMFYNNIIDKEFAIVTEGPVSAMKFAHVGNFVATMGKEISKDQLQLLKDSGIKRLYIALDPDAMDKLEKIRLFMENRLERTVECYIIQVPPHRGDFGDCTYDECQIAFNNAEKLDGTEFFGYIELKVKELFRFKNNK